MNNVIEVSFVCERLRKFGFAERRHIRLYGEELDLVSNATPDGDGFAVDAVNRKSGCKRRVRIPLSLVHTFRQEFELHQELSDKAAA